MSGIAIKNGGVVVDGAGGLCLGCCDYAGFDVGCFIEGDGTGCLSNPDWDEWPPFGGPGKTPAIYTATIDGFGTCPYPTGLPDINGVWHLPILNCSWPLGEACWKLVTSIGGVTVTFSLILCNSFTFPQFQVGIVGDTLFRRDPAIQCDIVVDNAPNFFAGCAYSGTVSWRPGQILAWDSGTGYVIGDMVAHEGVFYVCTADNTNQEPPNATYWDVA